VSRESFNKLPEQRQKMILDNGIAEFSRKPYTEASTDDITKASGISKGLLFHYFGSKREFYFYCLEQALWAITSGSAPVPRTDSFYDILFSIMDAKMKLCMQFPNETHFANMAARETGTEVSEGKNALIRKFMSLAKDNSKASLKRAVSVLPLKNPEESEKVSSGLSIYINALINQYLELYQEKPDDFFKAAETIKTELKAYIDMMLYGVAKEKTYEKN
jgi:TetR/AcrR family transcriptional regulator